MKFKLVLKFLSLFFLGLLGMALVFVSLMLSFESIVNQDYTNIISKCLIGLVGMLVFLIASYLTDKLRGEFK